LPLRELAAGEQQFAIPEAAVSALETAAKDRDTNALHTMFGPTGRDLVSPDAVQATQEFGVFVNRLNEKTELVRRSESNCVLQLGADAWPFPIPLVKADGQWRFDTEAGRQEVLNRRVGRNELGALAVCRAYVDAQREYAGKDRNGDEVLEYITNGHMIGGFALVAWPAEWGNSGVMTFIVNQQGKIYEKSLGPKTAELAKAMTRYEPDNGWSLVRWSSSSSRRARGSGLSCLADDLQLLIEAFG
jgi:hypothetical protein